MTFTSERWLTLFSAERGYRNPVTNFGRNLKKNSDRYVLPVGGPDARDETARKWRGRQK
jgi:hypothetical protein